MDQKRIALIGAVALMAALLAGLLMVACKGKTAVTPTPEAVVTEALTISGTQWEYRSVNANCDPDGSRLACYIFEDNDNTLIENFLAKKGLEGWELAGVADTENGTVQTFIFKRPLRVP